MKKSLIASAFIFAALSLPVGAQTMSPLTKAMMKSYQEILKNDPKDYFTYYQRAGQYFALSQYDEALNDLGNALKYIPAQETTLKSNILALMSDIYIEMKSYDRAYDVVEEALKISPSDYALLYKKGNSALYLNRPADAYRAFSAMRSLKSRSQEAFFGMARAQIMQNNFSEAHALLTEAEKADPTNALTFCRLGELYEEMGEDERAAASFLSGFSLAKKDNTRPLDELIKLGNKNFNAVETAINFALTKTSNRLPLHFLRANIAYSTEHYQSAYDAFKNLLNDKDAQIAEAYAKMARTCIALNKIDEAQSYANLATMYGDDLKAMIVKTEAAIAAGDNTLALTTIAKALRIAPQSIDAQLASAKADIAAEDYAGAAKTLKDLTVAEPGNMYTRMLLAYLKDKKLGQTAEAKEDYEQISRMPAHNSSEIVMTNLALYNSGKLWDADSNIETWLNENKTPTKDDLYWAGVYYAQTGKLDKGRQLIDQAVEKGYQNLYDLNRNTLANLNIAPLR